MITWKEIQDKINKKPMAIKTKEEQLAMSKKECMYYLNDNYILCHDAQLTFLVDKELCMAYIEKGHYLYDEAKEMIMNMKD